ncbi:MAG: YARHG domain-containing protein [Firmicutes bacterium]|nr:YARHG domain-containing protein [Bacillota bacterium]
MARVVCPRCGAINSEGASFCDQCGSRLTAADAGMRSQQAGYQQDPAVKSSGGKKWVIPLIIVLVVALGGGAFALIHFGKKAEPTEIDLVQNFDDRVLDLSGKDGEGRITGIDYDKVRENLSYNDQTDDARDFIDSVEYRTDKDDATDLVNGDKVKIICEYSESKAGEMGFKVKNGRNGTVETTIKIERLEAKDVTIQQSVYDLNQNYNNAAGLASASDESIRYSVSQEYLTTADIADLNYDATQRMINYIYALNGYEFQTAEAKAYFESFDWYLDIPNKTKDQDVAKSRFSQCERANEKLLIERRDALK